MFPFLRLTTALSVLMVCATPAVAGPAEDATVAVGTILDKFNGGDADAFVRAHTGNAVIVDEFAPYVWSGEGAAARWLDDYAKQATAGGITGGKVAYGKPVQASSDGKSAYVVLPTTYSFLQGGKTMAASGHMTFVMAKQADGWKIASWTYAAPAPAPAPKPAP